MTDFEKFATLGQGVSPMTLHRYGNAVDSYINPSIIEERRMNIATMDVFSRLMMDRIIFLGVPIDDDVPTSSRPNCCFWHRPTPRRIFRCISTPQVEASAQDWGYMIRCSSCRPMWRQSAREWPPQWGPSYCVQVQKASVQPCRTHV